MGCTTDLEFWTHWELYILQNAAWSTVNLSSAFWGNPTWSKTCYFTSKHAFHSVPCLSYGWIHNCQNGVTGKPIPTRQTYLRYNIPRVCFWLAIIHPRYILATKLVAKMYLGCTWRTKSWPKYILGNFQFWVWFGYYTTAMSKCNEFHNHFLFCLCCYI